MSNCNKCCGTCEFHEPFEQDRFQCTNQLSQYYMDETEYSDSCDEWEEK